MIRATLCDVDEVNGLLARDFGNCDFTEVLSEPLHVCLLEGSSGAVFMWRGPGIYEAHIFFDYRGREAVDFGHRLLDEMRREHGARLFWALIPVESRKVLMFTRLMGWESLGVRETRNGPNELFVSEKMICLQL
jgi:hypothetical protein